MKPSLREILIESHVAAIAIAVLLLGLLEFGFRALCTLLWPVATYLLTAVAIFDIPYFSRTFTLEDQYILVTTMSFLLGALANLAAAWVLAYWVYRVGPMRSLTQHYAHLPGRNFA
jgi:hypothetical protein